MKNARAELIGQLQRFELPAGLTVEQLFDASGLSEKAYDGMTVKVKGNTITISIPAQRDVDRIKKLRDKPVSSVPVHASFEVDMAFLRPNTTLVSKVLFDLVDGKRHWCIVDPMAELTHRLSKMIEGLVTPTRGRARYFTAKGEAKSTSMVTYVPNVRLARGIDLPFATESITEDSVRRYWREVRDTIREADHSRHGRDLSEKLAAAVHGIALSPKDARTGFDGVVEMTEAFVDTFYDSESTEPAAIPAGKWAMTKLAEAGLFTHLTDADKIRVCNDAICRYMLPAIFHPKVAVNAKVQDSGLHWLAGHERPDHLTIGGAPLGGVVLNTLALHLEPNLQQMVMVRESVANTLWRKHERETSFVLASVELGLDEPVFAIDGPEELEDILRKRLIGVDLPVGEPIAIGTGLTSKSSDEPDDDFPGLSKIEVTFHNVASVIVKSLRLTECQTGSGTSYYKLTLGLEESGPLVTGDKLIMPMHGDKGVAYVVSDSVMPEGVDAIMDDAKLLKTKEKTAADGTKYLAPKLPWQVELLNGTDRDWAPDEIPAFMKTQTFEEAKRRASVFGEETPLDRLMVEVEISSELFNAAAGKQQAMLLPIRFIGSAEHTSGRMTSPNEASCQVGSLLLSDHRVEQVAGVTRMLGAAQEYANMQAMLHRKSHILRRTKEGTVVLEVLDRKRVIKTLYPTVVTRRLVQASENSFALTAIQDAQPELSEDLRWKRAGRDHTGELPRTGVHSLDGTIADGNADGIVLVALPEGNQPLFDEEGRFQGRPIYPDYVFDVNSESGKTLGSVHTGFVWIPRFLADKSLRATAGLATDEDGNAITEYQLTEIGRALNELAMLGLRPTGKDSEKAYGHRISTTTGRLFTMEHLYKLHVQLFGSHYWKQNQYGKSYPVCESGLLTQEFAGRMYKKANRRRYTSFRTVLLVHPDVHPDEVWVDSAWLDELAQVRTEQGLKAAMDYATAHNSTYMEEGRTVLAHRWPKQFGVGSHVALTVRRAPECAVLVPGSFVINPITAEYGMAGDCDGDNIYFTRIPDYLRAILPKGMDREKSLDGQTWRAVFAKQLVQMKPSSYIPEKVMTRLLNPSITSIKPIEDLWVNWEEFASAMATGEKVPEGFEDFTPRPMEMAAMAFRYYSLKVAIGPAASTCLRGAIAGASLPNLFRVVHEAAIDKTLQSSGLSWKLLGELQVGLPPKGVLAYMEDLVCSYMVDYDTQKVDFELRRLEQSGDLREALLSSRSAQYGLTRAEGDYNAVQFAQTLRKPAFIRMIELQVGLIRKGTSNPLLNEYLDQLIQRFSEDIEELWSAPSGDLISPRAPRD